MSKIITASKLNRLWINGILPIKQDVDDHKAETDKALTDINTALDVMEEKVDGVVENGSGSKIFCTCTGDNAVGTVLTGNLNDKTYTATIDENGQATFLVNDCGTFVISGTEEYSVSATVVMEYFGIYRVELKGKSSGQVIDWIESAGLSYDSYSDLEELLEDEKAVRTLMTNRDSVDALPMLKTDMLKTVINHRHAAKWINYREYAYSTLSNIPEIKALMDETGMYGIYITTESKDRPLIPYMSSDTSSYGESSASSVYNGGYAWLAFDGKSSTKWVSESVNSKDDWIQYKFNTPTKVTKVMIFPGYADGARVKDFKVQASNNGSNFVDLYTGVCANVSDTKQYFSFVNNEYYLYYRLHISSTYNSEGRTQIWELQFYGQNGSNVRPLVPILTSDTATNGEVASSGGTRSGSAWHMFDNDPTTHCVLSNGPTTDNSYFQYQFVKPMLVTAIELNNYWNSSNPINTIGTFVVQGSNDGVVFDDIYEGVHAGSENDSVISRYEFENEAYYTYYRIKITSVGSSGASYGSLRYLQFYGEPISWMPKDLVPEMVDNKIPYGEATASSVYSNNTHYQPYKAFDGLPKMSWNSALGTTGYLQYKFVNPTCVTRFSMSNRLDSNTSAVAPPKDMELQGSNNGTSWTNIGEPLINNVTGPNGTSTYVLENESYYLYYRLSVLSSHGSNINIGELHFYGHQLKPLVPKMTDDTVPMGEVSVKNYYSNGTTSYKGYNAFDGDPSTVWYYNTNKGYIGYKFVIPTIVTKFTLTNASVQMASAVSAIKDFKLVASNDNTTWIPLGSFTNPSNDLSVTTMFDVINDTAYLYYRLEITSVHNSMISIGNIQFYGSPDYNARTYIYEHGLEILDLNTCVTGSGLAEKREDYLYTYKGSTAGSGEIYASEQLDMTNYSGMRVIPDRILYGSNTSAILAHVNANETAPSQKKLPGTYVGLTRTLVNPFTDFTLSLANVNGVLYADILSYNSTAANVLEASVSEWWLE